MGFVKLVLLLCLLAYSNGQVTTEGCGTTKGCFQNPDGCSPTSSGCRFVSWQYDSSTKEFTFELSGASSANYVAMAFTSSDTMENGDTYVCAGNNQFKTSTITGKTAPVDDATLATGVSLIQNQDNSGIVHCTFKRPASVSRVISSNTIDFNLETNNYRLLLASGPTSTVSSASTITTFHTVLYTKSGNLMDFKLTTGGTSAGVPSLIKAHAGLMLVAWLVLVTIGTTTARHYKRSWPGKQAGGKDLWFQIHRGIMVTCLLLTIIGFIIIFVEVNGFVTVQASINHAIIGIIVMALAIINPIMAIFRPHPGTPKRPYFNWAHYFVGFSARTLGFANLFIGVGLTAIGLPGWPLWVLVAFIVSHVLIELLLEYLSYKGRSSNTAPKTENIDMDGGDNANTTTDAKESTAGIKTGIYVFYIFLTWGYAIAILVAIGQA